MTRISGVCSVVTLFVAVLAALAAPGQANTTSDLFVAVNGRGTACTQQKPCQLQEAQTRVRDLAAVMQKDLTIHLSSGTYRVSTPLVFQEQDSGRNGHTIRWIGPAGRDAFIDGAVRLHKWKLEDRARNLWSSPVPHGAYALQLYVNGARAVRARHTGCGHPGLCSYRPQGLTGGGEVLAGVAHPEDVVAVFGVRWRDFHCRVSRVQGNDILMDQRCWHNSVVDSVKNGWSNASPKGKPFKGIDWFENAFEFLGTPGQFYIDRRKDVLYYVPREGENMRSADVELPLTERLLQVAGTPQRHVHDIVFQNLTFQHAGWHFDETSDGYVPLQAGYLVTGERNDLPHNGEGMVRIPSAVQVSGGERIRFDGDRFVHLGAAGVTLATGSRTSMVVHSSFEDLSGGGIFVGDIVASPKVPEDRSSGNIISRNTITRVALEYRDNVGIMGAFNDGLLIDHNTLSELPYTGISVGWGWDYEGEGDTQRDIHIRSNRLTRFMLVLHDGGAIYTQAQSPGSDVTENYISYRGGDNGNAIYLDERSRKYAVCGNVVWDEPAKMQEGQWLSAWSDWSGNLDIHDNWSDDPRTTMHNPGPTKRFENNHLALTIMPSEARAVMEASGAEGKDGPVTSCLTTPTKDSQ